MTAPRRRRRPHPPSTALCAGNEIEDQFWALAAALLKEPGLTRSTMMGLPCLRIDGRFFASLDRRTHCLVVKLPRAEVEALVDSGEALAFAPAGRVFREWAAFPPERFARWPEFLERARAFVGGVWEDTQG
jgi:hypothetical protein